MSLEPLRANGNSAEDCMGLLTDFKKEMQVHLVQVEVSVHSFFQTSQIQ